MNYHVTCMVLPIQELFVHIGVFCILFLGLINCVSKIALLWHIQVQFIDDNFGHIVTESIICFRNLYSYSRMGATDEWLDTTHHGMMILSLASMLYTVIHVRAMFDRYYYRSLTRLIDGQSVVEC